MAEAKQCDICKKLYIKNIDTEETDAYELLDTKSYVFLTGKPKLPLTKIILMCNDVKGTYDVCDNCGIKIKNFIKEICK